MRGGTEAASRLGPRSSGPMPPVYQPLSIFEWPWGVVQIIAPAVLAISETALVAWCSQSPLCERVRAFDAPPDESRRFSGCGTPRRWRLTGQPGPTVRWSVRGGSVERPYKYPFLPGARYRQERPRRIPTCIKPSMLTHCPSGLLAAQL